jgi:hypothetical protein
MHVKLAPHGRPAGEPPADLVLASEQDLDSAWLAGVLAPLLPDIAVEVLVSSRPLFWTRIASPLPVDVEDVWRCVADRGVAVRYVVSARGSGPLVTQPLDCTRNVPLRPYNWRTRAASRPTPVPEPWFLGERGLAIDRRWCGSGEGMRLAVIDDDAGFAERIDLDAEVRVGVTRVPRVSHHGACLVAWAVGTARSPSGEPFSGVSPDAAPRLYCIPPVGRDTVSLPVAIALAVDDGADVVVCAHPWPEPSNPLLDDALEYAVRCGRTGRGTPVLFPAPREEFGEPGRAPAKTPINLGSRASGTRAYLVRSIPPARAGRRVAGSDVRRLRRGNALLWRAPGEELERPFTDTTAPSDASVATAVAGGALLLVLSRNRRLTLPELDELLARTGVSASDCGAEVEGEPSRPGRLHITRACLGARDPVALTLVSMGEDEAAMRYLELRQSDTSLRWPYSGELGAWAARVLLRDADLAKTLQVLGRHARRVARRAPEATAGMGRAWLVRLAASLDRFHRAAEEWSAGPCRHDELPELVESVRRLLGGRNALGSRILWDRAVSELGRQLWLTAQDSTAERLASIPNPA